MSTLRRYGGAVLRRLGFRRPPPASGSAFSDAVYLRYGLEPGAPAPSETVQMWLDFSLSSVDRGRYAVTAMGGSSVFRGARVLDVGCAYGGFLVAASEAGARLLAGIDVNEELLKLARLQLADYRKSATLDRFDITAPDVVDKLGRFDVILCNDVLEHVVDPEAASAHLAELLDRGGSLFLQIPNGKSVEFMLKDGHYGLFGITLLDRMRAERVWAASYSDTYGVEHYAPLAYYLDIFSQAGLQLRVLNRPPDDLDAHIQDLGRQFDELESSLAALSPGDLDPDLIEEMQRRGRHEIEAFRHQVGLYRASVLAPERNIVTRSLWSTYGLTFWELVGHKRG